MRASIVVDPGHGGNAPLGRSTPFGVQGANGVCEKDVTLQIAHGVAARLGGGVFLTRDRDVNVSLADRARPSRELGASAFVSIHANGGRGGRGAEAWVHPQASASSIALAQDLLRELARYGGPHTPDSGVQRGDLALLSPSLHVDGAAACLLEVDHLDDPGSALADPRRIDEIAGAIARVLERHQTKRYGRAYAEPLALDLADFDDSVFSLVPDTQAVMVPNNIKQAQLDSLKRAWDAMQRGQGITLSGTSTHKRQFRQLLLDGLRFSPMIRTLFETMAHDTAHPITFDVARPANILVDGFQWQLNAAGVGSAAVGHHSLDLADFDVFPRVGTVNNVYYRLRSQMLVHAIAEARHGTLGNGYWASHVFATNEENRYRREQGAIGDGHPMPAFLPSAVRWDITNSVGAVIAWERWNLNAAQDVITSIDYNPTP